MGSTREEWQAAADREAAMRPVREESKGPIMSVATTSGIDRLADRCGLKADADNGLSRERLVAPSLWYWGTIGSCKRMASVLGWDQLKDEDCASTWDIYCNDEWMGQISTAGVGPMCAFKISLGPR